MVRPIASILISLIIGIITSYYISIDNIFLFSSLTLILILSVIFVFKKRNNDIWIIFLFFILGIMITNIKGESGLDDFRGIRHDFQGLIYERLDYNNDYSRYIVKLNMMDDKIYEEKVLLSIRGDRYYNLGDRIHINGILNEPSKNTNPMLFNQKIYLLSDNIHNTMSVGDYSANLLSKNTSILYRIKESFSNVTISLFKNNLSEKNAQLMTSIILGKSDLLMEDDLIRYRELGLAHVLAVSGLHIGIIVGFLMFAISRMGIKRKINIFMTLSIIWIYIILIGLPASAVRAGLMFTFLYMSKLGHEPYDGLNSIFASMIICLLINPYWLFNVGFQLSYAATISLLILGSRINIYPTRINILKSAYIMLSVNIGLLPMQSYYFNYIPLLGIISNLVTVPLLSIALIVGMIMMVISFIFPFLNYGLGFALDMILTFQYKLVEIIYSMDMVKFNIHSPGILEIGLYYLLIFIIFKVINIGKLPMMLKKSIYYYLLLYILILAIGLNFNDDIEIDFIDVGQGDGILIKTQDMNFLMDTGGSLFGNFDIGKNITLPYLKKQGLFNLDGVIITHFDEDHSQGLNAIMEDIEIDILLCSYLPNEDLLTKLASKGIPLKLLKKGDYIRLDHNTSLEIIWPLTNEDKLSSNNRSLVSILNYKDYKILFTGDMEREVEFILKDTLAKVDILKVPHHGSSSSTSIDLLKVIEPQESIISVGRNNSYSHPNEDVLSRLESIGSKIYRTDFMGMIRIKLDDSYIINQFIKDKLNMVFLFHNLAYYAIFILYFLISYILVKKYYSLWRDLSGL